MVVRVYKGPNGTFNVFITTSAGSVAVMVMTEEEIDALPEQLVEAFKKEIGEA